jgi:hypothetical protein
MSSKSNTIVVEINSSGLIKLIFLKTKLKNTEVIFFKFRIILEIMRKVKIKNH